jgi:hypothetical protein
MGMYTELHYNAELRKDVPTQVLDALRWMLGELDQPVDLPDHPLFKMTRAGFMLRCDSYYFAADTHSTLRLDDIDKQYRICIRCNLKNYEGEIEAFCDWIDPYVDAYDGDFLGFSRYEESEDPELIRKK